MSKMKTGCVMMTGPDAQMDHVGERLKPANPIPVKCPHCTFPDIDFVARPYLLARGVVSPAETSPAALGNFLVRERVRHILELAVPGACTFHPTAEFKTRKATDWWLAVPVAKLETYEPKTKVSVCSKCGEAKALDHLRGEIWGRMTRFDSGGADVFKTFAWHSQKTAEDALEETNNYRKKGGSPPLTWADYDLEPPPHAERWTRRTVERELYFSVRLEQLFKLAKVKGQLVRLLHFKDVKPSPEDEEWIAGKLALLAGHGLVDAPKAAKGKTATAAQKWFQDFLKRNAGKSAKALDFAAVEKKQKIVLPPDYKDFISTVGPKAFENINETAGFTAKVLPPGKLDFKNYRRGRVKDLDEEQAKIDGVMFASTEHGDAFVFDVSAKGGDYPVFWHDHEGNTLEPFAPNFAECIKRFAEKN
jgi:hypothetical protein